MNDGTFSAVDIPDGKALALGDASGGTFTADSNWLASNPGGLQNAYQSV